MTLVLPSPGLRTGTPELRLPLGAAMAPLEATIASLSTTLAPSSDQAGGRLAFVAAHPGEGTTTMAACAAIGLARFTRLEVVLIEGNLFNPGLLQQFGLTEALSLQDVLEGRASLGAALLASDVAHLRVLAAGRPGAAGPKTVERAAWQSLMADLGKEAAFVVLDAPPFLDRPEGRLLLEPFDRAIAVVRAGSTTREDVKKLIQGLRMAGLTPVGTVLNRCR